jgi:glycosyltransferase involved in cell wall biosynthesis
MAAGLLYEPVRAAPPVAQADVRAALDIRHVIIDDVSPHPSAANGIHRVAFNLAREQIAVGDAARIIFLRRAEMVGEVEAVELPTLILPLHGRKIMGHVISVAPRIIEAMTAGAGPGTIIHIHTARQTCLLSLARELSRRGLAFCITVHGRYSHVIDGNGRIANWKSALYLRLVERHAIEKARFVQAVSSAEADVIRRLAPRGNICVVPNAAYSSALGGIQQAPAHRTASFDQFPTFGYCGRYEIIHKGLDLLVEGFAIYRRNGGLGKLVFIGTGPARDVIATMAKTFGISDSVEVNGPCFGDDKQRKMRAWDFFVQPSRYDGVPLAALEAALAGLPLIVSTETGLAGHLTAAHAGIVFENLTPAMIASGLAKASNLSCDAWTDMAARARTLAIEIGDWTPIAAKLRALYTTPG